jgi:E3 ubiquitin-protein ligase TRIP12
MDPTILHMFSPVEIVKMLAGCTADFSREDLVASIKTERFDDHQDILEWFYDVVAELDERHKAAFVRFVTGSPRLRAGGLKEMRPGLTVRLSHNPDQPRALISATTCKHFIKVPAYASKDLMRERLLFGLENSKDYFGFT